MLLPDTGRAMRVIRLLQAAERLSIDADELLQQAGIRGEQIDDPDQRIPEALVLQVWQLLAARQPDNPDIGLDVGSSGDVRQGGILGYAVMHSKNAGHALRRIARFCRLISTRVDITLEEGPEAWRLESRVPPPLPGFRPPTDESVAGIVSVLREITGRQIDPVTVVCPYPRPDDLSALRRVFRSELSFDAACAAMTFRTRDMAMPLLNPETKLADYLDRLAEQELAALPRSDTYARRTGRTVWRQLSEGQPALDAVARDIGVSARTLQRRLREEGTSFAGVVDDLRRQMAPTLLENESLAVYEVAYLLGYADPSAFFRAFRRWHACSPAEYRQSPH